MPPRDRRECGVAGPQRPSVAWLIKDRGHAAGAADQGVGMPDRRRAWRIAGAGMVALAVAMGIGRFAFTPLLPMMLNDRTVDLGSAAWLASANYFGYLCGALLCACQPWIGTRLPRWSHVGASTMVRGGLVATAALTASVALPLPAAWPGLRFAAGVASAVVLVGTSGWCLAQLALLRASALGGVIFAGPGLGIVFSGLVAERMLQAHWRASSGWLLFGGLSCGLTACVWTAFSDAPGGGAPAATSTRTAPAPEPHGKDELAALTLAYGLAGFGYIVTATFLPVIARQALPGTPWLDLFWPLFGVGAVAGALLAAGLDPAGDLRPWLAACYAVQAAGIAVTLGWPSLAGFALGSSMLGLPFTAITFFAMREARRLRPESAASCMALITAMYGVGQVAGPPLVGHLLQAGGPAAAGFNESLRIAMIALLVGAAICIGWMRAWPRHRD